jgi:hypothetical protein
MKAHQQLQEASLKHFEDYWRFVLKFRNTEMPPVCFEELHHKV